MDADPEELSAAQLDELRQALHDLVAQLEAALDEASRSARPVRLDQQSVGRVSRVDAIQQQQMAAAGKRSIRLRLQQARAALGRLRSGEYGLCRACDEPIGYRRLAARPESPLCLRCQSGRERR